MNSWQNPGNKTKILQFSHWIQAGRPSNQWVLLWCKAFIFLCLLLNSPRDSGLDHNNSLQIRTFWMIMWSVISWSGLVFYFSFSHVALNYITIVYCFTLMALIQLLRCFVKVVIGLLKANIWELILCALKVIKPGYNWTCSLRELAYAWKNSPQRHLFIPCPLTQSVGLIMYQRPGEAKKWLHQ